MAVSTRGSSQTPCAELSSVPAVINSSASFGKRNCDRPLIFGNRNDNRRKTEAAALPGGRTAAADREIGLHHQLSHVRCIDMKEHVRANTSTRLHGVRGSSRTDNIDDNIEARLVDRIERQNDGFRRVASAEGNKNAPGTRAIATATDVFDVVADSHAAIVSQA